MTTSNINRAKTTTTLTFKIVESLTPLFTEDYEPIKNTIEIQVNDWDQDILSLAVKYAKSRPSNLDVPEDYPYIVTPDNFVTDEPIATFSKDIIATFVDEDGDVFEYSLDFGEEYEEFASYIHSVGRHSANQLNKLADLLRLDYTPLEI